jgi:hypothetical protein
MYAVWVLGFCWNVLFVSVYVGIKTYPLNVWMLPRDLTHWMYTITHGGQMFGINMIFLAWGYIITVNFLGFSNYLPYDFFSPLTIKFGKNKSDLFSKRAMSFVDKRGGTEIANLDYV